MCTATTPTTVAGLLERGPPWDFVFFWGHTPRTPGAVDASCLSQWYPAPFVLGGVRYPTAEHWMMAAKARAFRDDAVADAMLDSDDPAVAKRLGRSVRGFDRAVWARVAFDVVVAGTLAKFGQHPALRDFLLGTGDRVLVEASPEDTIWGIGHAARDPVAADPTRWRGANQLGFALMVARERLRPTP